MNKSTLLYFTRFLGFFVAISVPFVFNRDFLFSWICQSVIILNNQELTVHTCTGCRASKLYDTVRTMSNTVLNLLNTG